MTGSRAGSPRRSGTRKSIISRHPDNSLIFETPEAEKLFKKRHQKTKRHHPEWDEKIAQAYTVKRLLSRYPNLFQTHDAPVGNEGRMTDLYMDRTRKMDYVTAEAAFLFKHRFGKTIRHHPDWPMTKVHVYTVRRLIRKYPTVFQCTECL